MPPRQKSRSEKIESPSRTRISKLAKELGLDPELLKNALEEAEHVMKSSRQNVLTSEKRALRGLSTTLKNVIDRVSEESVLNRLSAAVHTPPKDRDEEGVEAYKAWWAARNRVKDAIEGATALARIIEAAEGLKLPHTRPQYVHWTYGIDFLLDHWTGRLGKKITVSGHENDPRNTRPSPTLEFTYGCMQALGEEITREACRSILRKLQKDRKGGLSAHERLRGSR